MTPPPTLVRLTLAHPEGLHARVAAMWVRSLRDCEVEVTVSWDGRTVNGRSVIELLTLGAPHGSVLEVRISGPMMPRPPWSPCVRWSNHLTPTSP